LGGALSSAGPPAASGSVALPRPQSPLEAAAQVRDSDMTAIILFVFFVIGGLLTFLYWAIIISAILSWLVAFNVINVRHPFAYQVVRFLDAVTAPILRPFRRFIPPLGGVDVSPIVALLVLIGVQRILMPALRDFLLRAFAM
jgi:YggT family protein